MGLSLENTMIPLHVVMVSRDRPVLAQQTIDSLRASLKTTEYTLTIVDDCSSPVASAYLHAQRERQQVLVVRSYANHILGDMKRSAVLKTETYFNAIGQWLCLIDNDVYFRPGWLERMIDMAEASEGGGYALWGGQNHPYHVGLPTVYPGMVDAPTLAGTHMFMRCGTWCKFGSAMVSEGPGVCRGEDVNFCAAIKASGGLIGVAVPEVVIDCGLTQTGGTQSPGIELKRARQVHGVIYE